MKKVLQINLGGIAFTIDDDAYRRLDGYMLDLERYFARSESHEDIMADIESRIAELFTEILRARTIVEITDIEAAIKIMGTPSDFGETVGSSSASSSGAWDIKTGKKLFRNTEDKVIGGVCSGLAAYFGIEEVLWVRLALAILFFTTGIGLVVYLVLWALVPEAKTAADKLAMAGEPANAQNIGRMVERGIEDLSTTIKDNWTHWRSQRKERKKNKRTFRDSGSKPVYVFVVFLIPLVLAVKAAGFIIKIVRRHIGSRRLLLQRNHFV